MNEARIRQLQNFIKESPNDPFLLYALALEFKNSQPLQALQYFTALLEQHPDYLPTYYHAALLFARQEADDKADSIFKQGISLAQQQQDLHALAELQNAYTNWQFGELDD